MQLYYVTDQKQLISSALHGAIGRAINAGVDWVQIREKDLPVRDLLSITQTAVEHASRAKTRVIVNDRLDVALAANASGVHLGGSSMPAAAARRMVSPEFLVGVSCHSLDDALAAEAAGANYVLLGPIFQTPSKLQYGPPLGIAKLAEVTGRVKVPVFALGGITVECASLCVANGAAGIAGIRIFQDAEDLEGVVRSLRNC
jgi:thiamine-phosphate pyrophosphorylase